MSALKLGHKTVTDNKTGRSYCTLRKSTPLTSIDSKHCTH